LILTAAEETTAARPPSVVKMIDFMVNAELGRSILKKEMNG
jgi:hypothetical protein